VAILETFDEYQIDEDNWMKGSDSYRSYILLANYGTYDCEEFKEWILEGGSQLDLGSMISKIDQLYFPLDIRLIANICANLADTLSPEEFSKWQSVTEHLARLNAVVLSGECTVNSWLTILEFAEKIWSRLRV
jgi:hypothetical protein